MSFVVQTEARGKSRESMLPYEEAFDQLTPDNQISILVDTGEVVADGKNKGKGKDALKHAGRFREIAKERNVGLTIGFTNLGDNHTRLTLQVGERRTFTPEQIKVRQEALAMDRIKRAIAKRVDVNGGTEEEATKWVADEMVRIQKFRDDQAKKAGNGAAAPKPIKKSA